jgi:hypothetical protein
VRLSDACGILCIHQNTFINWTWSNLKDSLSDVTWEQANTKIDSLNTIVGLTYHINYYLASLVSVLEGSPLIGKDKYSFDHPPINTKQDWDDFLIVIFKEAEDLVVMVEKLDEAILWTTFAEEKYGNYYRNIQGFVEHSHYHLGQIVVIKKMLTKTVPKV